ncbi:MAG: hypothetical protein RI907_2473 [Pseudomonadota bacterium]|jgi:serine/threonine-protein kinase HipA
MKLDELYLWYLGDPRCPALVGRLRLVEAGKGVSLQYDPAWVASGFPLSEDLPLSDIEQLPRWKGMAVGAVDDARPDRWGEQVIRFIDRPKRLSLMELVGCWRELWRSQAQGVDRDRWRTVADQVLQR